MPSKPSARSRLPRACRRRCANASSPDIRPSRSASQVEASVPMTTSGSRIGDGRTSQREPRSRTSQVRPTSPSLIWKVASKSAAAPRKRSGSSRNASVTRIRRCSCSEDGPCPPYGCTSHAPGTLQAVQAGQAGLAASAGRAANSGVRGRARTRIASARCVTCGSRTRSAASWPPLRPGDAEVGIYACGPTVYSRIHVGNARAFVVSDAARAASSPTRAAGPTLVINVTDVNDKIYEAAREAGVGSAEHAAEMIRLYDEDTDRLGLGRPDAEPRATETIARDRGADRGADRIRPRL